MNIFVFILLLVGLQMICLILGKRSSKGLKSQNDYFLAGRRIRLFPLMMTFLATQVGGGIILGSADEAYVFGWKVLFYPLGAALGLCLLGLGFGRKLAQFQVSTIAQIFDVAYRSPFLKKLASCLSIVCLFMVLIAQVIASNKFMVSMGIENNLWFILFWTIIIFYTSLGGLKGVVATDIVQAIFLGVTLLVSFGYVIFSMDVSIQDTLSSNSADVSFSKVYGWLFMPCLFMLIEQDMGQRCFAAKSPAIVSKATLFAALGMFIISIVPIFFGVMAQATKVAVPNGSSVLMTVIQNSNPFLTSFVSVAILCAIISTADSLINAIGSNLSQDFDYLKKGSIRLSQVLSVGIATSALFLSFCFTSVIDMLILSYELSVSCLFIPISIALFKKTRNTASAYLSIIFGAFGFILFRIVQIPFPKEILSIVFSLVGYYLGEIISWRNNYLIEKLISNRIKKKLFIR